MGKDRFLLNWEAFRTFGVRAAVICITLMAAFHYNISAPVTDGFHEGEYLGTLWTMRSYFAGGTAFPLLVHGPMDFIPVLLAGAISNDQSTIVLTRGINSFLGGVTWVLFLSSIWMALKWNGNRFVTGVFSFLMFLGMIIIIPSDAVERQQAFLGIRDLFLVACIWFVISGFSTQSTFRRSMFIFLGGVAAASSLYWAYDRFLAAVAFSGAVMLVLVYQRAWKSALALAAGAIVGLVLMPYLVPTGSFTENFGNLIYWIKLSSDVWYLPYFSRITAIPTALGMIVLLAVFTQRWFSQSSKQPRNSSTALVAGLLALQLFFLLKYFNLPRQPNNYYFVWPFVLLASAVTLDWPSLRLIDRGLNEAWQKVSSQPLFKLRSVGLVGLAFTAIVTNNMLTTSGFNVRALVKPANDQDLLPADVRAVKQQLAMTETGCVLLWSNEGVFSTAFQRPFCTKYMYSVYAAKSHEDDLLNQIIKSDPEMVVFDSPFWSMKIYDRSMQQRLPAVDQYLRSKYEFRNIGKYTVGTKKD